MAEGKPNETLISFESGHYIKVVGKWEGDAVWCHFRKEGGGMVHINKDKVEYMESFGPGDSSDRPDKHDNKKCAMPSTEKELNK